MFGLIEFFQLLLKKTNELTINDSEIVDILVTQDETITMTDNMETTVQDAEAKIALLLKKSYTFVNETGSRTDDGYVDETAKQRYAEFVG